nr:uncharacterized protein LOC108056040 [Drosophila takahashii]
MNVVSRSSLWRLAKKETEQVNTSDDNYEPQYTNEADNFVQDTICESNHILPDKSTILNNSLSQNQFEQLVQNLNSDNSNVARMERKIEKIESQISMLVDQNSKILAKVNKISEKFQAGLPKTEFPIKSLEELDEIEAEVTANHEKYVELFRTILAPEGVQKHLNRILSTSLLMNMNYAGTCSKTGLNSYVNLNMAMYESQKREGFTFGDYAKEVRTAFAKSKNKVYKSKTLSRHKEPKKE